MKTKLAITLSLAALVVALPAAGATGTVTETPIQTSNSQPVQIVSGPDGALWFTEAAGNKVGRITTDGAITNEYPVPTAASGLDDIAIGPDGNPWFAESAGNRIGSIGPSGTITESAPLAPGSQPISVVAGPDGNAWFTEHGTGRVGRLASDGTLIEYSAGITGRPLVIASGPDGNLWFTESPGNKIGRLDPAVGVTQEFVVPTAQSAPWEIAPGPDGALWFTERVAGKIGRITTDGAISEYAIPTPNSMPNTIRPGPDPNPAKDCAFQRDSMGEDAFEAEYLDFGDCVSRLATTETLWFSEDRGNRIAQITTGGDVFEFPPLTPNARPGGLAEGVDGNVWFAELAGNKIGRLDIKSDGRPAAAPGSRGGDAADDPLADAP